MEEKEYQDAFNQVLKAGFRAGSPIPWSDPAADPYADILAAIKAVEACRCTLFTSEGCPVHASNL